MVTSCTSPLIRTYSSRDRTSRPGPRPAQAEVDRDLELRAPMISRIRSTRTPSRSTPRSTMRSSPKVMATLSWSIRAADLPSAIMIRPQLGSGPVDRGLDQRRVGHAAGGDERVPAAGRPAHAERHDLGAALAVLDQHPGQALHQRLERRRRTAAAPGRPTRPRRFSARPLARMATVSLVDCVGVDGDPVERAIDRPADDAVQHVAGHRGVGRHEAEHRGQVRLDHPHALGDAAQRDRCDR